MLKIKLEMSNDNVTAEEFFDYCEELCKNNGIDIENYTNFNDWSKCYNPKYKEKTYTIGKKTYYKLTEQAPFKVHRYLQGQQNFLIEFTYTDNRIGYGHFLFEERKKES